MPPDHWAATVATSTKIPPTGMLVHPGTLCDHLHYAINLMAGLCSRGPSQILIYVMYPHTWVSYVVLLSYYSRTNEWHSERISVYRPTMNENKIFLFISNTSSRTSQSLPARACYSTLKRLSSPIDAISHAYSVLNAKEKIYSLNPYSTDRMWHKVIFKRSKSGLKSEFSFFKTSYLIKAKEPNRPYY